MFLSSCEKEPECIAGSPGNLTIVVTLQHHEYIVSNLKEYRDSVFVKFNANEFPGSNPTNYDAIYVGDYPSDTVALTNLSCGDYFLYATGFHTLHGVRVTGGIPFTTEQDSGLVYVTIPVSE